VEWPCLEAWRSAIFPFCNDKDIHIFMCGDMGRHAHAKKRKEYYAFDEGTRLY